MSFQSVFEVIIQLVNMLNTIYFGPISVLMLGCAVLIGGMVVAFIRGKRS